MKKLHISLTPVKSSQIEGVGHVGDTLAVNSVGAYLGKHIKPKHTFTKQDGKA